MSLLEDTLSELAKPQWEGSPTFSPAWDGAVMVAKNLSLTRPFREWGCSLIRFLGVARVLTVAPDQAAALPPLTADGWGGTPHYERLPRAMRGVTLPWETVYIDFGYMQRPDYEQLPKGNLAGALVGRDHPAGREGGLWITAFGGMEGRSGAVPWTTLIEGDDGLAVYTPGIMELTDEERAETEVAARETGHLDQHESLKDKADEEAWDSAERAVAILQWLESVNVEVVDAPLTRQVRRNAERRGKAIAKTVTVRLPRNYRPGRPRTANAIDFSHRFEVRGHYKFFPETTRLAQAAPEKLSWVPERDGYFRRLWCPPFVKGPADKPLVPKTRQLVGA